MTREQEVLALVENEGILRPRDLDRHGIPRTYLARLTAKGMLERIGRGLYALPSAVPSEHRSLVEVAKKYPDGVVCLLSALRFHDLTTQMPRAVWLARAAGARAPGSATVRVRVVRFSGAALAAGVEEHRIEGVAVRVFSPAKTVADCFKFRNKVGLDVALEALRDVVERRRATVDELVTFARVCRVENVMRPYLEAVL